MHIDGLYRFDNVAERCRVKAVTPADTHLPATVSVRYLPALRSVAGAALIPVSQVLVLLPQACPGQGDSIDGLADNYFTPGFSFAAGWGPERWFAAAPAVIRILVRPNALGRRLVHHHSYRVVLRLWVTCGVALSLGILLGDLERLLSQRVPLVADRPELLGEVAHRVWVLVGGHSGAGQRGFADELRDAYALAFGGLLEQPYVLVGEADRGACHGHACDYSLTTLVLAPMLASALEGVRKKC
jgi:hypothetical protein